MKLFEQKLKEQFNNHSLRLPTKIDYEESGETLKIHVRHPDKNMQNNENAFEAWSLALKTTGYETIKLDWDTSNIRDHKHYNRFLYRVEKFQRLYSWFKSKKTHSDHIFGDDVTKFINYGTTKVSRSTKGKLSENYYEEQLYKSEKFQNEHNIPVGYIERQLPVGVFTGNPPTEANALFTGKASAIDLYGIDEDGVFKIFELKIAGNRTAGALSEVFFYWCIITDVIAGRIRPTGDGKMRASELTWENIINSKRVENYLISSGTLHPIIKALCDEQQLGDFPLQYIENYQCE